MPGEIFSQYLYHDFQKDELKIEVMPEDLVDATIHHMYTYQDNGEDIWWHVQDVDIDIDQ